jgi:hypothetical protein
MLFQTRPSFDNVPRNEYLEPSELAAFLRRLVWGLKPREQHYLLMHLADMDVTGE